MAFSLPPYRPQSRTEWLEQYVVSAQEMADIESRVFAAGMPVAALMEKVASLITQRIQALYPSPNVKFGVLVGPGHNGGDALVVARELFLKGYAVVLYQPFHKLKELTAHHFCYATSLGIPKVDEIHLLHGCDVLIDGLFGFGLTRSLQGEIATAIDRLNQNQQPILSIDLPSGLHTDSGAVLGTAIRATHTLCLGLWKLAFLQDQGLAHIGQAELIDFGLPLADIQAIVGRTPACQRITPQRAIAPLGQPIPPDTHKYRRGHLLLVCGSQTYIGAAILAGLGARASGIGMLSLAVPESLKSIIVAQLPDAVIIGCPEQDGAIAQLPEDLNLDRYDAIACGPGLTPAALGVLKTLLPCACPLLLDADGLNLLASLDAATTLRDRTAPTVLTPHLGEFQRLFPNLTDQVMGDRLGAVRKAAIHSHACIVLKGARVAIASPYQISATDFGAEHERSYPVSVWLNPDSTPALARGGSGDVLTGLMGGLIAQGYREHPSISAFESAVISSVWWHAQAGRWAAQHRTIRGVDPITLSTALSPALQAFLDGQPPCH